jgi:hypothetical protein
VLSQRIVNNNFAILLADLIGEGLAVTINSATSNQIGMSNGAGGTYLSTTQDAGNQDLKFPADLTGTLATEAFVLASAGGGGGGGVAGAAQVFVQQDDPETTNPTYTGPAVWYILNNAGDIIGKKVRP